MARKQYAEVGRAAVWVRSQIGDGTMILDRACHLIMKINEYFERANGRIAMPVDGR
jgi:hypothetical protein